MTGTPGWTSCDRLLVLALSMHDQDVCPSGAGPLHYRDECDADMSAAEPEPVERVCVWLKASEDWQHERAQDKNPERGVMVGLVDASGH